MTMVTNLDRRIEPADLPEWMDEPCTYEDFHQCLFDLAQLNRLTLASRPTLDFLDRLVARDRQREPLRILDVGCGGGDMLRAIERWALRRGVAVELTGIDLNPYAERAAKDFTNRSTRITFLTGDAFSYTGPVDVVLSSLFTHHLSSAEIVAYLRWSDEVAARGWFVNDLCREATPYRLIGPLAKLLRWHRFVQHDGPVSFRRSFREADWQRLTAEAGLQAEAVRMTRWTPARLCVEHMKEKMQ
jgi:SAM-dependent methyltransferase